mgnify:FL=1
MRDALIREVDRLGVRRISRVTITDIFKDDAGEAAGAAGFHTQSGETFGF